MPHKQYYFRDGRFHFFRFVQTFFYHFVMSLLIAWMSMRMSRRCEKRFGVDFFLFSTIFSKRKGEGRGYFQGRVGTLNNIYSDDETSGRGSQAIAITRL